MTVYTPSGFAVAPVMFEDLGFCRSYCTRMIVHPLFPLGLLHFLHPDVGMRPTREIRIAGIPFALEVVAVGCHRPDPVFSFAWAALDGRLCEML